LEVWPQYTVIRPVFPVAADVQGAHVVSVRDRGRGILIY
jgi:hypothetical protein